MICLDPDCRSTIKYDTTKHHEGYTVLLIQDKPWKVLGTTRTTDLPNGDLIFETVRSGYVTHISIADNNGREILNTPITVKINIGSWDNFILNVNLT